MKIRKLNIMLEKLIIIHYLDKFKSVLFARDLPNANFIKQCECGIVSS